MWFLYALGIIAGGIAPIQVGINGQLGTLLKSPFAAGCINFMGGTLVLLAIVAFSPGGLGLLTHITKVPPYLLTGGLCGALFVTSALFLGPKLGAATTLALIIAGQLIVSVLLDQLGWLGFPQHTISPLRLVGVLSLITGVILIERF